MTKNVKSYKLKKKKEGTKIIIKKLKENIVDYNNDVDEQCCSHTFIVFFLININALDYENI